MKIKVFDISQKSNKMTCICFNNEYYRNFTTALKHMVQLKTLNWTAMCTLILYNLSRKLLLQQVFPQLSRYIINNLLSLFNWKSVWYLRTTKYLQIPLSVFHCHQLWKALRSFSWTTYFKLLVVYKSFSFTQYMWMCVRTGGKNFLLLLWE